jgi:NADPH2:quinone reductase
MQHFRRARPGRRHGCRPHCRHLRKTPDEIREAFAAAAPQGFDLILDLVWGDVVNQAIDQANVNARIVQIGNASGSIAPLLAPVFRNKHISIIGQSIFVAPQDVRRDAYTKLGNAAARGEITLDTSVSPLRSVVSSWETLVAGSPTKLVIVP